MTRTYVDPGFRSLSSTFAGLTSPVRVGPSQRPATRAAVRSWLARSADLLLAWFERARQRRELLRFDDHLLRDIGLTRADALAEAAKPFWRA